VAIPILFWMLECTECGTRRVVHDCYLVFIGTPNDPRTLEGVGYGGPPLAERYSCTKGCTAAMRAIGSITVLQTQMRHADVRTTLKVYAHVIPQSQRDSMERIARRSIGMLTGAA
jgi:hypothetical protein